MVLELNKNGYQRKTLKFFTTLIKVNRVDLCYVARFSNVLLLTKYFLALT